MIQYGDDPSNQDKPSWEGISAGETSRLASEGSYGLTELCCQARSAVRDGGNTEQGEGDQSAKKKEIAISFAEVGFIDTAVLQLLIAFKRWIEPDTKLKISSLSGEVEDILSLSGLKTAFL